MSYDLNKIGNVSLMASSNSHITSVGPKCFHFTFTWEMFWFRRKISFLSSICRGYSWNSPSSSTWITTQSIRWLELCTYFLSNETWKTSCILTFGGKANLYAMGPILSRIWKGPKYLSASLVQVPNLKVLFWCLTLRHTWSPTFDYLCVCFLLT
jgi:hypothetical protein